MMDLLLGVVSGSVLNALWRHTDINKYEKGLEVLEHFHHFLLGMIVYVVTGNLFFAGLGLPLILDESLVQKHPFSLGSGHEVESVLLGVVLVMITLLLWVVKTYL